MRPREPGNAQDGQTVGPVALYSQPKTTNRAVSGERPGFGQAVPMGEQRGCQAMVPPAPGVSAATRTPCPGASEKASQLPSPTGRPRLPAGAPRTAKGKCAMGQAYPGGQGRGCQPSASGGPAQEPEGVGDGTCSLPPPVPRGARTLPALWVRRAGLCPTSRLRPVAGGWGCAIVCARVRWHGNSEREAGGSLIAICQAECQDRDEKKINIKRKRH